MCRAYFNQFYEAVQARQAVSECAGGGQQKAVEMLDGEIEARAPFWMVPRPGS